MSGLILNVESLFQPIKDDHLFKDDHFWILPDEEVVEPKESIEEQLGTDKKIRNNSRKEDFDVISEDTVISNKVAPE